LIYKEMVVHLAEEGEIETSKDTVLEKSRARQRKLGWIAIHNSQHPGEVGVARGWRSQCNSVVLVH
jgi:hypothetical protein